MHASKNPRRVVTSAITATMAAAWMTGLTGCSMINDTDADYVSVCKDPATGKRIEDDKCPRDRNAHYAGTGPHWVYMPIGSGGASAPRVGDSVPSGYSATKPATGKVTTAGRSGGSFAKGGGTSHGGVGSGSHGGSGS